MTGSNMEVSNKNTCVSGRATRTGSTGRLTDKILANPHTALRKEPWQQILKEEDHEHQCFNIGKQWWDLGNEGNPGLILQRSLLDGGEGKSTCSNIKLAVWLMTKSTKSKTWGMTTTSTKS